MMHCPNLASVAYEIQRRKDAIALLQEARDAITCISETQRKLYNISPSLATRMDEVGYRTNPHDHDN